MMEMYVLCDCHKVDLVPVHKTLVVPVGGRQVLKVEFLMRQHCADG